MHEYDMNINMHVLGMLTYKQTCMPHACVTHDTSTYGLALKT